MTFSHDTESALMAAVALVNSALVPDTLTAVSDLDDFFSEHGYTGRHERTRAELEEVRAIRGVLQEMLTADRDLAVELVNVQLDRHRAVPRLVRHGQVGWHVHAVDDDRPLAQRIVVETAMAMIDVIRDDELSRLGVCADEGCDGLVIDLSRNRSRRFCSTTCGNRHAAAAHRARNR